MKLKVKVLVNFVLLGVVTSLLHATNVDMYTLVVGAADLADSVSMWQKIAERDSAKMRDTVMLIEKKVKLDAHYSNLYSVELIHGDTLFLNRTNNSGNRELFVCAEPDTADQFFIFFAFVDTGSNPNMTKKIPVPLRVIRIHYELGERLYIPGVSAAPETTEVGFNDILELAQFDTNGYFQKLMDFLKRVPPTRIRSLRTVPLMGELRFRGTDLGNGDYRNYAAIHSSHRYEKATTTGGHRDKIVVGATAPRLPYYLDIALFPLERVSFSADVLSAPNGLGILGFGFEVGFEDRVLSLISYQTSYLRVLGRLLFTFSGRMNNIGDDYFVDLKLGGRIPRSMRYAKSRGLFPPSWILKYDDPKLNITSGTIFEASLGRLDHRLPFVNIYFSPGSSDFSSPAYDDTATTKLKPHQAFYSTSQWQASLAYYWNTDRGGKNRFRLDLGAGAYDAKIVQYDSVGKPVSEEPTLVHGKTSVQALISLDYTHASNNNVQLFGLRFHWFYNRLTLGAWMKILRIGNSETRLEATYITSPLGRSLHPWEGSNAFRLQLRYRLGF